MSRVARTFFSGALMAMLAVPMVAIVASAPAEAATRPLLVKCGDPVGFETSNEDWRVQSFMKDGTAGLFTAYPAATWNSSDGDPSNGSLEVPDVDNGWTEVVTPTLSPDFSTDYSSLLGRTITFSYKYDVAAQPVTNNVYVALRGAGGDAAYFPFLDQVGASGSWATVTVPLDASEWFSGFTYDDGPVAPAPSASDFADILSNLDEIAFSMEGSNIQNDVTLIDNLAIDCAGATTPIVTCDDGVTFDADNQGWRQQTFMQGATAGLLTSYGQASWISDDGDPAAGSVEVPDLDDGWTELVTPSLSLTNSDDYSSLVGSDLTFSYKYLTQGQQVSNNVYVVLRNTTGDAVYFPFLDQVGVTGSWSTVTVPLDASQWFSSFTYDDGPVAPAPSASDLESILSDLDEIGFSMEGSNVRNDITRFDNLRIDCDPDVVDDDDPALPDGAPDTGTQPENMWLPLGALALGVVVAGGAAVALRRS